MTTYHPDLHAHLPPQDLTAIEEKAAIVTHAYDILRHPHTRATHLLQLVGEPLDETSQQDLVGTDFLMEVMEFREAIENANEADVLKQLADETNASIKTLLVECEDSFHSQDYERAKMLSAKLQYWNRIERTLHEKIEPE